MVPMSRTMFMPGVSRSMRIIDARRCGPASGSVTTMASTKSATDALEAYHLWPSMTHSSPSSTAPRW